MAVFCFKNCNKCLALQHEFCYERGLAVQWRPLFLLLLYSIFKLETVASSFLLFLDRLQLKSKPAWFFGLIGLNYRSFTLVVRTDFTCFHLVMAANEETKTQKSLLFSLISSGFSVFVKTPQIIVKWYGRNDVDLASFLILNVRCI